MKQKTTVLYDKNGNEMIVPVHKALSVNAPSARYTGYKPETVLLKKGSIRLKGYISLPCDVILERDVPAKLRDGVTIYFVKAPSKWHLCIRLLYFSLPEPYFSDWQQFLFPLWFLSRSPG